MKKQKTIMIITEAVIFGLALGVVLTGTYFHFQKLTWDEEYCGFFNQTEKLELCENIAGKCNILFESYNETLQWEYMQTMIWKDKAFKLNETNKEWQGKWNNIVPLYQKCDSDYRNFTEYHNKYFVDYRYLGFNCQQPTTITNTVINTIIEPLECSQNWYHKCSGEGDICCW